MPLSSNMSAGIMQSASGGQPTQGAQSSNLPLGSYPLPSVGAGSPVQLPQGSGLFGTAMDPFGVPYGQQSYKETKLFGGQSDLAKALATQSMGINLTANQFNQPQVPQGLNNALQNYVSSTGNPYLQSMFQSYQPQLASQGLQQQQTYQNALRNLLEQGYVQGGEIYGSSIGAVAAAKNIQKQKEAQRAALVSGLVGGIVGGLTGNQYGEGTTSGGLSGVLASG